MMKDQQNNNSRNDIQTEIEKSLRLILEDGQVTELRALSVGNRPPHTEAGYFTDITKMAAAAADLTNRSKGVYFTPNPINPELLGRKCNAVKWINKDDPLTGDSNVLSRLWLLIDTDYQRPANITATDDQTEQAFDKVSSIRDFLGILGWPDPIIASSGNGGHLMYRIDLPNDDEGLVLSVLDGLSFEFDDEYVHVDTSVHNQSRIWKLYGTFARKGDQVPEQNRYHRQALIDWELTPELLDVVSVAQLQQIARIKPVEEEQVATHGSFNLDGWIDRHDIALSDKKTFDKGIVWSFAQCPFSEAHADGAKLVKYSSGAVAAFCYHNSCKDKNWHSLRDLVEPGWRESSRADEETAGRYGDMFVFQDAINGSYMIDDQYGLRAMEKNKLKDIVMGATGRSLGRISGYKLDYIPEVEVGYIPEQGIYNSWKPSPLQVEARKMIENGLTAEEALRKAPVFGVTLKHMFPNVDHREYFLDFLAATVQGYKLNVGIVLNDKGGTGKTLIMEYMLSEFLDGNCKKFSRRQLNDKFNDWMQNKQLLFGDEIAINKDNRNDVEDFLKDFITGKKQPIRGMRENWVEVSNRANMIIASNKTTPIYVEDTDRRWNFFNPGTVIDVDHNEPWHLIHNPEWKALKIEDTIDGRNRALAEAVYVGAYLYLREPNLKKLMNAISTDVKDHVIEAQRDRFTEFAFRVKNRDWEWIDENSDNSAYMEYNVAFSRTRLIDHLKTNMKYVVIDDLYNVFKLIYEKTIIAKPTFTRKMVERDWLQRTDHKPYLLDYTDISKQVRVLMIQSSSV